MAGMSRSSESRESTAGSRERFEELLRPLLPQLYGFAVRLSRNPETARDLVQEASLRAYRTFSGFEPGTNGRAWLFTILYSVFVNAYRKAAREPVVSMEEMEARFERRLEPPDWEAYREIIDNPGLTWGPSEVEQALARLPDGFRTAVMLVDVEELTYEEASEVMDCPVGTLRSRLFRGRKLLASELQDYARSRGLIGKRGPEA
jgi:RNA polymerase sigma-70 factor (ECF subfamily)